MATHTLELIEPFFTDMLLERKTFEVRWERPDRRFAEGDVITFVYADGPAPSFQRTVTYVLRGLEWYGLPRDIAVLGLK